jgi:DNA helicase-2/ATP-dependent DNA helicase PcrA
VHLLATGRARPNEILGVTFTNKAAREMQPASAAWWARRRRDALARHVPRRVRPASCGRHAEARGLASNFTDPRHRRPGALLKQLIQADGIDEKRWPARMLSHFIDGWKNRAVTPDNVPAADVSAFDHKGWTFTPPIRRGCGT